MEEKDCICFSKCCECCHCQFLLQESKNELFCCCCPLKLGVWIVGFFIFLVTFIYSLYVVYLHFNQYFDSYFVSMLFIVLIPLYISFTIFFLYINSRSSMGRQKLKVGIMLAAVSVILYTFWSCFYILALYKRKEVYEGAGDTDNPENYKQISKKNYFIKEIVSNLFVFSFLVYSYVMFNIWQQIADDEADDEDFNCC